MGAAKPATLADKYNLTALEADWVAAQVDAGSDVNAAVRYIRGERVGPASDPGYRPLSADAAEDLGVVVVEPEPFDSDQLLALHAEDEVPFTPAPVEVDEEVEPDGE